MKNPWEREDSNLLGEKRERYHCAMRPPPPLRLELFAESVHILLVLPKTAQVNKHFLLSKTQLRCNSTRELIRTHY